MNLLPSTIYLVISVVTVAAGAIQVKMGRMNTKQFSRLVFGQVVLFGLLAWGGFFDGLADAALALFR